MSFRCGNCNEPQVSGTRPIRRVTKIREKSYLGGGHGWEVAKELGLCSPCTNSVRDVAPRSVKV